MAISDRDPANLDQAAEEPPLRHPGAASGRPAHAVRPVTRASRLAAGAGIAATLVAIGLGAAALIRLPGPTRAGPDVLQAITVTSPPTDPLPLSGPDILALLDRSPDFGPLRDPQRRASCLAGLGYPAATRVLGAQPIKIGERSSVVLVLPSGQVDTVIALAVPPSCSSANTGLLADTTVRRP